MAENTEPTTGIAIPPVEAAEPVAVAGRAQVLQTPDITSAQLVGAIPILAKLLSAFGVYTLTASQTEALTLAVGGGAALFLADAVIRVGRSVNPNKG